ncbi:MAG: U32 family peptidase [Clostridia bacterium]
MFNKEFSGLDVHASTQMTIHNLECAQTMQKLGFKRAVLARELSIQKFMI